MRRGLLSVFESAAPTLILSLVILGAAVVYGLYTNHNAPETPETAAAAAPAAQ